MVPHKLHFFSLNPGVIQNYLCISKAKLRFNNAKDIKIINKQTTYLLKKPKGKGNKNELHDKKH